MSEDTLHHVIRWNLENRTHILNSAVTETNTHDHPLDQSDGVSALYSPLICVERRLEDGLTTDAWVGGSQGWCGSRDRHDLHIRPAKVVALEQ
jgi:hypothetical protein